METVTDFIFLGSKLALLVRKPMTNLDSVLKSRDNTLPKTICIVKATMFPVVWMDVRVGP